MTVKTVEVFKGSTLRIDFDETDCREPLFINSQVVSEAGVRPGVTLSEEDIAGIIKLNDKRKAKERALYLLDVKDYCYTEMFRKLRKNYDEDICYEVTNRLAEIGLIDDVRYAKRYAEHLCRVKGYGYYRAKEQMRLRGLTPDIIKEALEPWREDSGDRIKELIEKKYAKYLDGDPKNLAKVKSALVRMGYSYSEINAAVKEYGEDTFYDE